MNKSVNPIFSKESQKKLAEIYKIGLLEVWDEHMANWCLKHSVYLIPIDGGKGIINIDKEHIETKFYSGYSDIGQGMSFEENNKFIDGVNNEIENYFINANLSSINHMISQLQEIVDGSTNYKIVQRRHYRGQTENNCVRSFEIYRYWDSIPSDSKPLDIEDVKTILEAYKLYKIDHKKRLFTYLKKYGRKHIRMSSYWIDR